MTDTETTVARTDAPGNEARTHLERLGDGLRHHGWKAEVTEVNGLAVRVVNPAAPVMRERVLCREGVGGWEFVWWWGVAVAPVDQLDRAVRVIMYVLRTVEYEGRS
jgi:hypothetical protein